MAHIAEFTVEGLAGRKDLVAEKLDRHVNIFFGPNGCGKTSLLKILHSAMAGNAVMLATVPFHRAEVKIHSVAFDKIVTRVCEKKQAAHNLRMNHGDLWIALLSRQRVLKRMSLH